MPYTHLTIAAHEAETAAYERGTVPCPACHGAQCEVCHRTGRVSATAARMSAQAIVDGVCGFADAVRTERVQAGTKRAERAA